MTTMVDPLTGLPRLLLGNAQGIWTILDNNGTFESQVGQSASGVQLGSPTAQLANVDRNGNLQITQFYYGAVQPSSAAAQIAGAMFYGSSQDNGGPVSDPNILSDGNITYFQAASDYSGDAVGVATDQQGLGSAYQYFMPCCGGNDLDFFQYIGPGLSGAGLAAAGQAGGGYVSRTFGLFQQAGTLPTPDPQWPFGQGTDFAVNPVDSAEVAISSNAGRIFVTQNAGVTWFDIGDPSVFGNPASFDLALAYGAPDPSAPVGVGNLGNFISTLLRQTGNDLRHPERRRQRQQQQLDQHQRRPGPQARHRDHHRPDPRQPRRLRHHDRRRLLHEQLRRHGRDLGQHHEQHLQSAVLDLRPELQPDDGRAIRN